MMKDNDGSTRRSVSLSDLLKNSPKCLCHAITHLDTSPHCCRSVLRSCCPPGDSSARCSRCPRSHTRTRHWSQSSCRRGGRETPGRRWPAPCRRLRSSPGGRHRPEPVLQSGGSRPRHSDIRPRHHRRRGRRSGCWHLPSHNLHNIVLTRQ